MYEYTSNTLIIKAFENGWRSIYLPILQTQNIDCYTIMRQRQGWRVRHGRRTAPETSAGQARACWGLLARLSAAPSWSSPRLPQHIHILSKELTLPLRRTKQASKGNVQNRNQKMSTSSRQTSKRRKTSCQSLSRAGVGGFRVSFGLFLSLPPCVSLNNNSFPISLKHR